MSIVILLMLIMTACPAITEAATRLGLFHTQEEVDIWELRSINGPYRSTHDVSSNSPGDWNRIHAKANDFLANYTTATYERWSGPPTGTCFTGPQNVVSRTLGERMRDAAFAYLVCSGAPSACTNSATAYRDAVRTKLLDQAAQAGTNFASSPPWCANVGGPDPTLDINMWLTKILLAYDYIRPSLSAGDQSTLDTWFLNAGIYLKDILHRFYVTRFPNYLTENYSPAGGNTGSRGTLYFGGPNFLEFHAVWDNQFAVLARTFGLIGLVVNDATLKDRAERFAKDYLKYAVWYTNTSNIVTPGEYYRWSGPFPPIGWAYASGTLGPVVTLADAFARAGDTEIYDFTTTTGVHGSDGGPKSLAAAITTHFKLMDHQLLRYGSSTSTTDANLLIDNFNEPTGWHHVGDVWLTMANNYFKDIYWKSIYMRTAANVLGYPSSPATGGFEAWGGEQGIFPAVLFLFGQMADDAGAHPGLDPYNLTEGDMLAPKPPSLSVASGGPMSIDLTITLPTQNTDDSAYNDPGGIRIRYCANAGCTPATVLDIGHVTTYELTGLNSSTLYRLEIAAFDVNGNFSTFSTPIQEATTDPAPPPDLVALWTANDASGTTLAETAGFTGGPFTGSLCEAATCATQGPSWVAGELSGAIQCDGVNDNVEITDHATLDITGNLTITWWMKLLSTANVNNTPDTATVLTKVSTGGTPYHIAVINTSTPNFRWFHSGAGMTFTSYVLPIAPADLTHYAITRNTSAMTIHLYAGGNLVQSLPYSGTPLASTNPIRLCASFNRDTFGYAHLIADDIRLYSGILPDIDIAAQAQGAAVGAGEFHANAWRVRNIDEPENGRWQRPVGFTGRIVLKNQARVRFLIERTVDNSAITEFIPQCQSPAGGDWTGAWFLDNDCSANPFCLGFDRQLPSGDVSTTAQLIAASSFQAGGRVYRAFQILTDPQLSIPAGKSIEVEYAIRVADGTALGTTLGCRMVLGNGTLLDQWEEAIIQVMSPLAQGDY